MITSVGKLQVEVSPDPLVDHRYTIRSLPSNGSQPFWVFPGAYTKGAVFCPRLGEGLTVRYPHAPSPELLVLIETFHRSHAVMPLLDKMVEEFPDAQAIIDEVLV